MRGARILNRLVAPLKLGGAELLPTLVKLGSAVSLSGMRRSALQQLGKNLLVQSARYEAALGALCQGGARGMAATFERRMAVQVCFTSTVSLDVSLSCDNPQDFASYTVQSVGVLSLHDSH